jgi:hypothetical protein
MIAITNICSLNLEFLDLGNYIMDKFYLYKFNIKLNAIFIH